MYTNTLDRVFYPCPETNYSVFPEVRAELIRHMAQVFDNGAATAIVFSYVLLNRESAPYIDIYVFSRTSSDPGYERFIICSGTRLPGDREERFLSFIRDRATVMDRDSFEIVNMAVPMLFPQWNYMGDLSAPAGIALEYLYFCSHPGVKEILYKAHLENIAFYLNQIPNVNIVGSTPEAILDLPMKVLRILNQKELVDTLFSEYRTDLFLNVYRCFSDRIGNALPTALQFSYLEALYLEGSFGGGGFLRPVYESLSEKDANTRIIDSYRRYLAICHLLEEHYPSIKKLKIPKSSDIERELAKVERLKCFIDEQPSVERHIKQRKARAWFEYSDDNYTVVQPASLFDFFWESCNQHSCVMEYIEPYAEGNTTILFLRRKNAPNKSFVTIEVRNWMINQVYTTNNRLPNIKVYQFLEKYARDKFLFLDLYTLIMNTVAIAESNSDEELLVDYAIRYQKRTTIL